jgi:predicted enzyme related to lactoylglutathione lyase
MSDRVVWFDPSGEGILAVIVDSEGNRVALHSNTGK